MLHAREYKKNLGASVRDAFESWMGQEVVVQLGFGLIKVSLRGVLLPALRETLLLKPEAGPKIEIAKTKVLAIEEVERAPMAFLGMSFRRIHSIKALARLKNLNLSRR